jgi:hypothetical protein
MAHSPKAQVDRQVAARLGFLLTKQPLANPSSVGILCDDQFSRIHDIGSGPLMPDWELRFNTHDLWTSLTSLNEQLGAIETPEDEDERSTLDYLLAITSHVGSRKADTPPLLVTPNALGGTATALQGVSDYVEGWQAGTYTNAQMDSIAEALVQSLTAWPPATPVQLADGDADYVARVREAAESAIETLREKQSSLDGKLESLKTQQTALEEQIADQTQTITTAVATLETTSTEALNDAKAAWSQERDEQKAKADEKLDELTDLEMQAQDLVHSATAASVATDYGEYARKETRSAWICDIAAGLVGSVGVGALIVHLYAADAGADGEVGLSLTRLAASLGTLGVAALIGQRGSQHHREARAAKRTDLALRKVGPFTVNLPEDAQQLILEETTDRIFIKGELDRSAPRGSLVDKLRQKRADRPPNDSTTQ